MTLKEIRTKILKGDFSGLLGLSKGKEGIPPSAVATLFYSLPTDAAINAFLQFQPTKQVYVFPYLDSQVQRKIIKGIDKEKAAYILNTISSDDRTIFLSSIKGTERESFIAFLNEPNKKAAYNILGYPEKSIAGLVNTDFATIDTNMTIAQAREHLQKFHKDTEAANVIYVVNKEGKLIDDIPVRRFVLNDPNKTIEEILD